MTPANAALSVAYHIVFTDGDIGHLPHHFRSLYGKASSHWRPYQLSPERAEAAAGHLRTLRSPAGRTTDRVRAIEALCAEFGSALNWGQVENVLYHLSFSWPLLVLSDCVGETTVGGFSLPVAVDIDLDRRHRTNPGPELTVFADSNGVLDASEWYPSLARAVEAAKVFWAGNHGHFGDLLRDDVWHAGVSFDFRYAEEMVRGVADRMPLHDRSMEAYFSQVLLARFLGRLPSLPSVVTGQIGERHVDWRTTVHVDRGSSQTWKKVGDFNFEWPERVEDKLHFVFRTRYFTRLVLPSLKRLAERDPARAERLSRFISEHAQEQTAEVNHVDSLTNVCDAVQDHGWRQHNYVRCPDVRAAVHPSGVPSRVPGASLIRREARIHEYDLFGETRTCLEALRGSNSGVLEMPLEVDVFSVAAALSRIERLRREMPRYDSQRNWIQPSLSWVFLRVADGEPASRFWHVVYTSAGATPEQFERLCYSSSSDEAAGHITDVINRFIPVREALSHRAPDLLVLIGTERFRSRRDVLTPAGSPLEFGPIMEALKPRLNPHPHMKMREMLGGTRIILVDKDPSVPTAGPNKRIQPELREALDRLRIFRYGFTQQMAGLLLRGIISEGEELNGARVRNFLHMLEQEGYLGRSGNDYFIRLLPIKASTEAEQRRSLSALHLTAAIGFAPYLSRVPVPGLDLDRAFRPDNIHEAQHHLREALRHAKSEAASQNRRSVIRTALQRLTRFAGIQDWTTVAELPPGGASRHAYQLCKEIIAKWRGQGKTLHPNQLIMAATVTEHWWLEMLNAVNNPAISEEQRAGHRRTAERLRDEIVALYREAEQNCGIFAAEREYNRLHLVTAFATFLEAHAVTEAETKLAVACNEEAISLLERGIDGAMVRGEWFEARGDAEPSHAGARRFYEMGVRFAPKWRQLWIKMYGTYVLEYGTVAGCEPPLETVPRDEVLAIVTGAYGGFCRQRGCSSHIAARWGVGLRQLRNRWRSDRQVTRILGSYHG